MSDPPLNNAALRALKPDLSYINMRCCFDGKGRMTFLGVATRADEIENANGADESQS